jgi:DNA-binding response OmpR family regulator
MYNKLCKKGTCVMDDRILVLDDERKIADLVELYLKNENYTVFKYYNAKEALECIDKIELDLAINTHECYLNEKPLSLTPTEFSILHILCENKGNVISSEKLFHQIWGDEYFSKGNNTITVHIRHLREKMNDTNENPRYIKTVWWVGYKIEA